MEKREPWEKKSPFSALSVYQRILLLLLIVMIAAFTGLAFWFQSHPGLVCVGMDGKKALLVRSQTGETVRYSGKLDGPAPIRPGAPLAQRPGGSGGAPGGYGGLSGRLYPAGAHDKRLLGQRPGMGGRQRLC